MLYLLGLELQKYWGPFRLFTSHSFLMFVGLYVGFFMVYVILPKTFKYLPLDRGREYASQSKNSVGKPTGSGISFISVFILVAIIVVPFDFKELMFLGILFLVCLSGYLDDSSKKPWGEYKKGIIDLVLSALAAVLVLSNNGTKLWLPLTSDILYPHPLIYIIIAIVIIWTSINSTNCSDGVDGLSGTLALIALISLGFLFYFVLGNVDVSRYLLLPYYKNGAKWAIMIFSLIGSVSAYLWYNAFPSSVLMGDAGSRAIGFFIGVMVLNTGNPFILFIVSTMLLVNGGTGLIKIALLRFFKIRILHNTRFPLHDHVRENMKWSNAQVLLKFSIIQIMLIIGMLGIFIKIR